MYKERKETLGILNYLVYGLIVVLIITIIIVIMLKSSNKKVEKKVEMILYSEKQLEDIETNYNQEFASNMANFKYNVIDYYKDKLGKEKVNMNLTLQELYDKHFSEVLSVDAIACDSNSNVIITKVGSEYKLSFSLICSEKVSLVTYLGKYDYCKDNALCEKKVEKTTKKSETQKDDKNNNKDDKTENEKIDNEKVENENTVTENDNKKDSVNSKYLYYEYTLKPNDNIGVYSEWSNWDKNKIEATVMMEVEKKTEDETKTENCTETKEETYISGYKTEEYITGYTTKKVKIDTKKVQTGTRQRVVNGKVVVEKIYREDPIYAYQEVPVYATKKTPIYATRKVTVNNCKEKVDYYRYRVFEYNKGLNYIVYSTNINDSDLLNRGYIKTGNTKEI